VKKLIVLKGQNILGNLTLKNNPAFNFATTWCGSDYMHDLGLNVKAGMSTSDADLLAGVSVIILEASDPGPVYRLTAESFNPSTAAEHTYCPPSRLSGVLYKSSSHNTMVVMSDADCEVWVYAGTTDPVAVLRNDTLEILDYSGWSKVCIHKRETLESFAATTSYPEEWYGLEEEFDELRLKERKKRSKDRSYPENMQDRFSKCIPVRTTEDPEFNSTLEFLEWVFAQSYIHDVYKYYAREERKIKKKARRAKAKKVSIKRRSTRRAKAARHAAVLTY
jgi:hypothetical protein